MKWKKVGRDILKYHSSLTLTLTFIGHHENKRKKARSKVRVKENNAQKKILTLHKYKVQDYLSVKIKSHRITESSLEKC